MKNIFTLLCILLFFSNCSYLKVYKFVQSREVNFYDNKDVSFNLVNNRIFIEDSLNYFLDIGGSSAFNLNSKDKFIFKDSIAIGKVVNYTGENLENKIYLLDNISNPLFKSKNFHMSQWDSNLNCDEYYDILLGADLFYNKGLKIEFENSYISVYEEVYDNLEGYIELNVKKFKGKFFEIEITLNTTPVVFKIDTGNPFGALINSETFNRVNFPTVTPIFINNDLKLDHSIAEVIFEDKSSQINLLHHPRTVNNLLGVDFMKNFNWIFDFKKGRVFIKKINDSFEEANLNRVVTRNNNMLLIESYKGPKYNIKKKVLSVDGIEITEENLCYFKNLLNSTKNWEEFSIKTVKH